MRKRIGSLAAAAVLLMAVSAGAQQVTKGTVEGVTNFAKVESTIACGGATTPGAVAELKKLGYKSVINLRQASEAGADVDAEAAAAKAAGVNYFHLPVNGSAPDPAMVDRFIAAVGDQANQPVYVHCASGNRAAAFWMIKRLVVDHWDEEKASTEATALGLTSAPLKKFATDYAAAHAR